MSGPRRPPAVFRLVLALAFVGSGSLVAGATTNVENPDAQARLKEARQASKHAPGNDSLRYELALAYADVNTIENRVQAIEIFEDLRHVYDRTTRYHRDRARVFEACQQFDRARESLEILLDIDPGDVRARTDVARLRLEEFLWRFDLTQARRMFEVLGPALEAAPDDREALYYASLALEIMSGLPEQRSPSLSRQGLELARRIVVVDPGDIPGRYLLAVHAMDLGDYDLADRMFEEAVAAAPDDVRHSFANAAGRTAPAAAQAGLVSRDPAGKATYERVYWRHHDPSPLTDINENKLEIYRRLALADILFGKAHKGIRGWDTDPGRAFVRYGAPRSHYYEAGELLSQVPPISLKAPLVGVGTGLYKVTTPLVLVPPSWNWDFEFRGLHFPLRFEDTMLSGNYLSDPGTREVLEVLVNATPVVFRDAPPGPLRELALTSVGTLGERRNSARQDFYLGIPLWRPLGDGGWLNDVVLEIVVRDTTRTIVRQVKHRATPDDVVSIFDGAVQTLLLNQSWELPQGDYTMAGFIEDTDRKLNGVESQMLVVRDYRVTGGPIISDLDLTLRPAVAASRVTVDRLGERYIPNPLRVADDGRQLDIFYEVYGLVEKEGTAFVETRYTVLPRAWVQGFDRLVRQGEEEPDRLVDVAAADALADDGELTQENYLDVRFPPAGLAVTRGRAARGTRVPIPNLAPGEYALTMTLTDLHAGKSTVAQTTFQVLSAEQRDQLVAMGHGHRP